MFKKRRRKKLSDQAAQRGGLIGPQEGKINILFHSKFFHYDRIVSCDEVYPGCHFFTDTSFFEQADAVVFHIPNLQQWGGLRKPDHQIWVAETYESDLNYPRQRDPVFMEPFDLKMSYHLDADVPVPYLKTRTVERYKEKPVEKTEQALASCFISNVATRSCREHYLEELARHMPIDFYGKLMPNRQLEHDEGPVTKLETIARYRFNLAFENAIDPDYVTEKFFDPLEVGTVPIYFGAPNIETFSPGDHCFINVSDFESPKALAEFIVSLAEDELAYEKYFDWKQQPLRSQYLDLCELKHPPSFYRLGKLIRELKSGI